MDREDVAFLEQVARPVAIAVENALDYEKGVKDRDKETKQSLPLKEGVRAEFGKIIGSSPAPKSALELVSIVAPTDSSVLTLGETGTLSTNNPSHLEQISRGQMNSPALPESTDQWVNASDTTLVESVKNGNHSAYSELVKRHSTLAFRIAYRITQNKQDAEDAMQDSLFLAFKRINSFDGRSAFATWLTRIAINTSLMILRKKRKHPSTSLDDDEEEDQQISDPAPGPELLMARLERAAAVRDAVRRLSPSLRSSIEARYWKELSTHDAAALNGITVAAAKSRQLRGRRRLRIMLDQAFGETDRCPSH